MHGVSIYQFRKANISAALLIPLLAISMLAIGAPLITAKSVATVNPLAYQKLSHDLIGAVGQRSTSLDVVIETTGPYDLLVAEIERLGGIVTQKYQSVEAIAVTIPADKLLEISSNDIVKHIYKDNMRYLSGEIGNVGLSPPMEPEPEFIGDTFEITTEPIEITELGSITPSTYHISKLTHADEVWAETDSGADSLVAIIDTGCWNETYYWDVNGQTYYPWYYIADPNITNVIGGIDLSYDVGTPHQGYGNPMNHYHGTGCGYFLAAHVYIIFGVGHPWGEAMYRYDPEGTWKDGMGRVWVTCLGIAPAAQIYAIKVFDHTGAGIPSSLVMAGIDHAIQQKLTGAYDIDVISMSLGGGVGADGEDPTDLLVDAATEAGITVSVAAGNEGPATMKVGSPGSSKTCITVGGAIDPIHERVYADAVTGVPYLGVYYYPHDELGMWYHSSRGPTADGRLKPDVVATSSHLFFGLPPAELPYTVGLGSGTSFACPQVSGEAALLNAYIEMHGLDLGPAHIKGAIMEGAEPMTDCVDFEQGAGYINVYNSLELLKTTQPEWVPEEIWPRHVIDSWWLPPIELLELEDGKATVENVVLEPLRYAYFALPVWSEVDSIKITLSGVQLAPPEAQNPVWGDAAAIYVSTAARGGIGERQGDYPVHRVYFTGDGVLLWAMDTDFQPGIVRIVFEGDFSSYQPVIIKEVTIEVTGVWVGSISNRVTLSNFGVPVDEAQVSVYPGEIQKFIDHVKEGETDVYYFTIPDEAGFAYVTLSWIRDWSRWATSDLDIIIINPDGSVNVEGATGFSPEAAIIEGPGTYIILVDGYGVYFGKNELYLLEIIYFASPTPSWSSEIIALDRPYKQIKAPVSGVAVAWIHDTIFDVWYIAGFATCNGRGH
jgi:subtilisin family serine protease